MPHRSFASIPHWRDVWEPDEPTTEFGPGRVPLPRFTEPLDEGYPAAWFMGPRAENAHILRELIDHAIGSHESYRKSFHPEDAIVITEAAKQNPAYGQGLDTLRQKFWELTASLRDFTTPYYNMRYQGHMLWDTTLASLVGYFSTMLHNPNNVTVQASTLTTYLEMMVGWDLASMLGFPFEDEFDPAGAPDVRIHPHGHLTSGGTVANVEATWSARELKVLPLATHHALTSQDNPLYWFTDDQKSQITVRIYRNGSYEHVPLVDLEPWQLMNVRQDDALDLPRKVLSQAPPVVPGDRGQLRWTERVVWEMLLQNSVNSIGMEGVMGLFTKKHDLPPIGSPIILTPSSKHYSWPKAMAMLGIGTESVVDVKVDQQARMDLADLEEKLNRARAGWHPVLMVVAVLGSTEESAMDDIAGILDLRERFRQKGLEFNVHVDAAWGGYYASILRRDYANPSEDNRTQESDPFIEPAEIDYQASSSAWEAEGAGARYPIYLSEHAVTQIRHIRKADSATVDPHKTGYVPYPAGAICYRNDEMKRLITYGAPVIGSGENAASVGEFGVEGSKPGAAAAAVYLSHAVVRPSHSGHGRLMNASLVNAKMFYRGILQLNLDGEGPNTSFIAVPLAEPGGGARQGTDAAAYRTWLHTSDDPAYPKALRALLDSVHEALPHPNDPHARARDERFDRAAYDVARQFGPDQNIVDYMFNYRLADGSVNQDMARLNQFNRAIYQLTHVHTGKIKGFALDMEGAVSDVNRYDLLVSRSDMWRSSYGDQFVIPFLRRLGIDRFGPGDEEVQRIYDIEGDGDHEGPRERAERRLDCYRMMSMLRSVVMDPFLADPDLDNELFVDKWMRTMRTIVDGVADRFRTGDIPDLECSE